MNLSIFLSYKNNVAEPGPVLDSLDKANINSFWFLFDLHLEL